MRHAVTTPCEAPVCGNRAKSKRTPLCDRHDSNLKRYGSFDPPAIRLACDECGEPFWSARRRARFCSKPCYQEWWRKAKAADTASRCQVKIGPCSICGVVFVARVTRGAGAYRCSGECKAEAKRRHNRERERSIHAETGEWRGRVQERKNPAIVEKNQQRQKRYDEEMPRRERYPESAQARDARRRMRKLHNTPQPVEPFTRREIGERDGWICQICDDAIDPTLEYPAPRSQSLDHKTPISKGGAHTRENCQISHLECNVAKSDRVLDLAG